MGGIETIAIAFNKRWRNATAVPRLAQFQGGIFPGVGCNGCGRVNSKGQ